jgi:hypothetical protein
MFIRWKSPGFSQKPASYSLVKKNSFWAFVGLILSIAAFPIHGQSSGPVFSSSPVTTVNDNEFYQYPIVLQNGAEAVLTLDQGPSWLSIEGAGAVSTFAGSGSGLTDGTGSGAQFKVNWGLALDAAGNLYVADNFNHAIRKVTPEGVVTTLAGTGAAGNTDGNGSVAKFRNPSYLAVDDQGNVYVSDSGNHRIRKITPAGVVSTLAGSTVGRVNGTGTATKFSDPRGLVFDAAGNLYVADSDNRSIRMITSAGVVTTIAGNGVAGYVDATGTNARFDDPTGLAIDGAGNLYIADNHNRRIRKMTPAGVVTTIAGSGTIGTANGTGTAASFNALEGLALDAAGNLYVADPGTHRIRKITPQGVVSDFAGNGAIGTADGLGTSAQFRFPRGLAINASGNLFISDGGNHKIRKATTGFSLFGDAKGNAGEYNISLLATSSGSNTATQSFTLSVADVTPPEFSSASFTKVAENIAGTVYTAIATDSNTGATLTYSLGTSLDESPFSIDGALISFKNAPDFENPQDADLDNEYHVEVKVSDGIHETSLTIRIEVLNQSDLPTITSSPPTEVGTRRDYQYIMEVDEKEPLSFSATGLPDWLSLHHRNEVVDNTNTVTFTQPGGDELELTIGSLKAWDEQGNAYVFSSVSGGIYKVTPGGQVSHLAGSGSGFQDGTGENAQFSFISSMIVDESGNVYVSDFSNASVRKISPEGVVTTLMSDGLLGPTPPDVGPTGTTPRDLVLDNEGNLFVADTDNRRLLKISKSTGSITEALAQGLSNGFCLVYDQQSGDLLIGDTWNYQIKRLAPDGSVSVFAGSGTTGFGTETATGTDASFGAVRALVMDDDGNIYGAFNKDLRKINPDGVITHMVSRSNFIDGMSFDRFGNLNLRNSRRDEVVVYTDYQLQGVAPDQAETNEITVTSTAANGATDSRSFTLNVNELAPLAFTSPTTVTVPENLIGLFYTMETNRSEGVVYDFKGFPGNGSRRNGTEFVNGNQLIFSKSSGDYEGTTEAGRHWSYLMTANDGYDEVSQIVSFELINVFGDPTFTSTPITSIREDEYYQYPVSIVGGEQSGVEGVSIPSWLELKQQATVTTLSGSDQGFTDGPGSSAQFYANWGIEFDQEGNLYVADYFNHAIRKVTPDGTVSTIAGNGTEGFQDGQGTNALFRRPSYLVFDEDGNLYVSDSGNNRIRKITPDGTVSTFFGAGPGSADGDIATGRLQDPRGLVFDSSGNLLVADYNGIRRISTNGILSTITPNYRWDKTGLAIDSEDNIYFPISAPEGYQGGVGKYAYDGSSLTLTETYGLPKGYIEDIELDEAGNLYTTHVRPVGGFYISLVPAGSTVGEVLAGGLTNEANEPTHRDGVGTYARFRYPRGLAVDDLGDLYISEAGNNKIRKLNVSLQLRGNPAGQVGTHSVSLRSYNDSDDTFNQNFDITVTSENAPLFTSANTVDFSENGTAVAYTALVTHHTPVTYSLGNGSDEALFEIDGSTGALSFLSPPDFENPEDADGNNAYVVEIKATDQANVVGVMTLTLTVTNANDDFTGPVITSTDPADEAVNFNGTTITFTFDENVVRGIGRIGVYDAANDSELTGAGVGSSRVSVTDNVVTVDLLVPLPPDTEVYINIPAGAFKDASGNEFAGILDNSTLNLSTPATPQLTASNPVDNATDFTGSTLSLTFDQNMLAGTGRISIFDAADDSEITGAGVSSSRVTISGNTVTLDLINPLPLDKDYYVSIPASALKGTSDNFFPGILDKTTLSFSGATTPALTAANPMDDATDFTGTELTLTFDRDMFAGTGRISIMDASDDSEVTGAGVGSSRVDFTNNVVTVDLIIPLPLDKQYYVAVPASALKDANDNFYPGILDKTTLNFSGATTPQLTGVTPADESSEFGGSTIQFTFDRNMTVGSGRIQVMDAADDSEITGAGVSSPRVSINNNVVTLDLINPLPLNKTVYVNIPGSAFRDAGNNFYPGILDKTTLNFSTRSTPQLLSTTPLDEATEFAGSTITFTFDRNVSKGTGRIRVLDMSDDSEITGAGVGSPRVSIGDNVVTLDLVRALPADKQVYVQVPGSAFKDSNNTFYEGILDNTTLNFASVTTPRLVSSNPTDNATGFSGTTITLTFDRNIQADRGRLRLFNAADDTPVTGSGVSGPRVSIVDNVVTFDLINAMPINSNFYLQIPGRAFRDVNNQYYTGILDKTTLNFSTGVAAGSANLIVLEPMQTTQPTKVLTVYPNPADSQITLDLSSLGGTANLQIVSMDGIQKLRKEQVEEAELTVDVSRYVEGVYLIVAQSADGTMIYEKFMIRR